MSWSGRFTFFSAGWVLSAVILLSAGWSLAANGLRAADSEVAPPSPPPPSPADGSDRQRIDALEKTIAELQRSFRALNQQPGATSARPAATGPTKGVQLGGYGEIHANFVEGQTNDKIDIHRFVLYVGYEFADWITWHSEIEIEHAFVQGGAVSADGNGELELEQCFLDFAIDKAFGIRVGRVLVPVGLTNLRHEPMQFPGVERSSLDNVIIPTTWWSDGMGIYGTPLPELRYQAYVVAGLNGSGFSALNGIRGGRLKGRPSINEAAFTARIEIHPLIRADRDLGHLQFAVSTFHGGLNNGPNGAVPNVNASIGLYAVDAAYSYGIIDLRAVMAWAKISGTGTLPAGVASEIFGWNAELAVHLMPADWKTGRLEHADLLLFVRFDAYDTQYKMRSGIARNPAGDRTDFTFGGMFKVTSNVGLKADYQIRDDATTTDLPDLLNFGAVWEF